VNTPLHIALIRQTYRPDGGAERFVSRALDALAGRGVEVTLYARSWQPQPGIHFERCDPPALGRLTRDWGFARAVCGRLRERNFDLVQSHERLTCCDVYRAGDGVHRAWLERRGGGKMRWRDRISLYHGYLLNTERAMFESPRLRAVICNSQMVKNEILHYFAIDPAKLHVVYNGVDLDLFHPRYREARTEKLRAIGVPVDVPVFMFVGSGFERKGLAVLLQAMARLSNKPAWLIVLGQDKSMARYRTLAEQLGIASRVYWAGAVDEPSSWYGLGDALVLPTLYDPFPNVVLEAMASGLPVVTSSSCGGAELVREEVNGFVLRHDDLSGLAKVMTVLLDRDRACKMGAASRMAVGSYSITAMTEQLIKLYSILLEGFGRK
jgi:UDP-glucose:(heptosyl)LPS alpha-1,3-glucosyltransferase